MKRLWPGFALLLVIASITSALACMVQLDKKVKIDEATLTVNYIHKGFTPEGHSHASKGDTMNVLVNLTITNTGNVVREFSSSDFKLEDSSGRQYGSITIDDFESLDKITIAPGKDATVNLLFNVKPAGNNRFKLCYKCDDAVGEVTRIDL